MLKSEAILKLVRHLLLPVLVLAAANLPACAIYDQDLLDDAFGGNGVTTSGGSTGGGNVSGGSGGTGGVTTGGSAPGGGMGGEMTGGASGGDTGGGDTGGGNTGGATGGTGGSGTGGAACVDAPGAFTGLGTTEVLDSFEFDLPLLANDVAEWNGFWSGAGDPGAAASLTPRGTSEMWNPDEGYAELCDDAGYALHIEASGSTAWGVSFAAKFTEPATDVDLSAYDGVVFWARTENQSVLKVAYATSTLPNADIGVSAITPVPKNWKQIKIPFSATSFDPSELALVKIIGVAPGGKGDIDLWIDNVTFYADSAE